MNGPLTVCSFAPLNPLAGPVVWGLRTARAFAERPELGVRWFNVVAGSPDLHGLFRAATPAGESAHWLFLDKGRYENRWTAIRRAARRHPPLAGADLLLPNESAEGWVAAEFLRRRAGGPGVVAVLHSDEELYYRLAGPAVSTLEGVLAVSDDIAAEYRRRTPARPVERLWYGVPVADPLPQRSSDGPLRVGYVGRLESVQKRCLQLADLAAALEATGTDYELHVAGDGPDAAELHRRLAGRRAVVHGRLPPEGVTDMLRRLDAFIMVSAYEGTSIALLEAMGQGVVPVVTDVSGTRDVIVPGTNGWTVPVGDIRAMAGHLAALARDPEARRRMSVAARDAVAARYGVAAAAAALAASLRRAAERPRMPFRLAAGHPRIGRFDRRWLPNPLAQALRWLSIRAAGHPAPVN